MSWSPASLPWLPRPPEDLRARCLALVDRTDDVGPELVALAGHRLSGPQLELLARTLAGCGDRARLPATFRLGVVGNGRLEPLVPLLEATALRHGVRLSVDLVSADPPAPFVLSGEHRARAWDGVLLALDRHGLPLAQGADAALAYLTTLADALREVPGRVVLLQTVPRDPLPLFGSYDAQSPESERTVLDAFHRGLLAHVAGSPDVLVDVAALAETVGLAAWAPPAPWYLARFPFAHAMAPLYADHVARVVAALRGRARKCLVLDLDNTLWGGIVGDDGVAGLRLGQGDPGGEAFVAMQRYALRLRERGVVLAVCSKNDEDRAREPFRTHPAMVLREDHIAAFVANWVDKAANLKAIAESLDLGLDALVFCDDNPAERAQVRAALPQVAVPELPDDPALYPYVLAAAGWFEAVAFSDEDRRRADAYQANASRRALQVRAGDLTTFLASLDMRLSARPFDAAGRARIAQLVNRSNQWNLTTRRYTEADVARLEADPTRYTLQLSLADCFGDNGMISVLVCRRDGATWEIETWLMSCRVLNRRVEEAALEKLVTAALAEGAERIVGAYVPSDRNTLVRDHYARLGFRPLPSEGDTTRWELKLAEVRLPTLPFTHVP